MRLRYRFYVQTEADDFQDRFTEETRFRTQDSDLAGFSAHTVGTKFTWHPTIDSSFGIGLDYVVRSDGLDQVLGSVGWTRTF